MLAPGHGFPIGSGGIDSQCNSFSSIYVCAFVRIYIYILERWRGGFSVRSTHRQALSGLPKSQAHHTPRWSAGDNRLEPVRLWSLHSVSLFIHSHLRNSCLYSLSYLHFARPHSVFPTIVAWDAGKVDDAKQLFESDWTSLITYAFFLSFMTSISYHFILFAHSSLCARLILKFLI